MTASCKSSPSLSPPPRFPWIMVIDASLTVRCVLGITLSQAGWWVLAFATPLEALQYLAVHEATPPVALILDLDQHCPDGFALTRLIRAQQSPALRAVPILAISLRDGFLDRIKARLAGVNALLVRPFRVQEILTTLGRVLLAQRADMQKELAS
jgi:twitching motility two-component system response regulator PilG